MYFSNGTLWKTGKPVLKLESKLIKAADLAHMRLLPEADLGPAKGLRSYTLAGQERLLRELLVLVNFGDQPEPLGEYVRKHHEPFFSSACLGGHLERSKHAINQIRPAFRLDGFSTVSLILAARLT